MRDIEGADRIIYALAVINRCAIASAGHADRFVSVQVKLGVKELKPKAPRGFFGKKVSQAGTIIDGGLKVLAVVGDIVKRKVRTATLSQAQIVILGQRHSSEKRGDDLGTCGGHGERGHHEKRS